MNDGQRAGERVVGQSRDWMRFYQEVRVGYDDISASCHHGHQLVSHPSVRCVVTTAV